MIRDATAADAESIAAIYNHYIEHTVVSFEETPVTANEMRGRMAAVVERYPWLVVETDEGLAGYAYANRWNARWAYKHTAEVSVYLASDATRRGYGSMLYAELLDRLKSLEVHTIIGGITLPNEASVALHEKFGFTKAAHYREVGYKFDRWLDVGYWQLLLAFPDEQKDD